MTLKNKECGNIVIDTSIALCFLALVLTVWLIISSNIHEKRMVDIENKQKLFTNEYIEKNPLMITVINAYNECQNRSYEVIEGCVSHVTKNSDEKQKLESYIDSLENIL